MTSKKSNFVYEDTVYDFLHNNVMQKIIEDPDYAENYLYEQGYDVEEINNEATKFRNTIDSVILMCNSVRVDISEKHYGIYTSCTVSYKKPKNTAITCNRFDSKLKIPINCDPHHLRNFSRLTNCMKQRATSAKDDIADY